MDGHGDVWRLLEELRWDDRAPDCPHCAARDAGYRLSPGRRLTARPVWKCRRCRRQFSVLTGTVLAGTRVDLRVWLAEIERVARNLSGGDPAIDRPVASRAAQRHVERVVAATLQVEPVRGVIADLAAGPRQSSR